MPRGEGGIPAPRTARGVGARCRLAGNLPYRYGSKLRATGLAGPHAVLSVAKADGSTATFTYDENGNMVNGDGRAIAFDLMDRPVQVVQNGTTDFSYAPDGAR